MIQSYDILKAAEHARIAIRRGDLAGAERWFRIAERAATIVNRLSALAEREANNAVRRRVESPRY